MYGVLCILLLYYSKPKKSPFRPARPCHFLRHRVIQLKENQNTPRATTEQKACVKPTGEQAACFFVPGACNVHAFVVIQPRSTSYV